VFKAGADPEQQLLDWTGLRRDLTARGLLGADTVVGTPGWQDTGKVAYALGPDVTVLCLNPDSRQFSFGPRPAAYAGRDLLIVSTKPVTPASLAANGVRFDSLDELPPVSLGHPARPGQRLLLYRGVRLEAAGG
jgi:hypothetical protein